MNIISKILPSMVAVALVASCSKMHDEPLVQQDREQEVELAIPVASTRTMIGDDGKTTNWVVGDKIALWAEKSDDAGNFHGNLSSHGKFLSKTGPCGLVLLAQKDYNGIELV